MISPPIDPVGGSVDETNKFLADETAKWRRFVDQAGVISGTWSEATRNVSGLVQGRGGGGVFEVVVSTAGFTGNIVLRTTGNKQSITMRADSQFQGASISLSK